MEIDKPQKCLYRRKISLRLALILLAFVLVGSLYVIDDFIDKYNSCRAELFIRQIISSISSGTEDYKNFCDNKDIRYIEPNKDKITGNYKIIDIDRDHRLLWWKLVHEEFRYSILFNHQYVIDISIGSFPDGEFKVYDWGKPRPYEQKVGGGGINKGNK